MWVTTLFILLSCFHENSARVLNISYPQHVAGLRETEGSFWTQTKSLFVNKSLI